MMKPTPKNPHFLKYIIDCGKKYCQENQHKAVITESVFNPAHSFLRGIKKEKTWLLFQYLLEWTCHD